MKAIKISDRNWDTSANRFFDNRSSEACSSTYSDFPPTFWLRGSDRVSSPLKGGLSSALELRGFPPSIL